MADLELEQEVEKMVDWSVQFLEHFSSYPANGEYTAGNLINRYISYCKIRNEQSIADAVKYDIKIKQKAHVPHHAVDSYLEDVFPSLRKKIQRALAVSLENDPDILYDGDRRGRLYRYKTTRPSIRARDVAVFISYYLYQTPVELSIRDLWEEVREWATVFHQQVEGKNISATRIAKKPYLETLIKEKYNTKDFPFSFSHPENLSKYKNPYDPCDLSEWCENVYTKKWFKHSFSNILRYLRKELDCISVGSKRGLWIHKNHCTKNKNNTRQGIIRIEPRDNPLSDDSIPPQIPEKVIFKDTGEKLEQWCENQFNLVRATAFPHAYFEKDNESVNDEENGKGTKGDFIFRESDANGIEYTSIMFEMKDNMESTKGQTNDFHLSKLDKIRKKNKCEYAVLVSMLEPENELYNAGPVDMSPKYGKMYVIRPQFFIPMITLVRNAAMNSHKIRNELALVKEQNIDITNFEEDLENVKTHFAKNYDTAKNYEKTRDQIDTSLFRIKEVSSKGVDLTDILEFGNYFSRLYDRVLSLDNPDVAPIMLKQLETQIQLMLIKIQKGTANRDVPRFRRNRLSEKFDEIHYESRLDGNNTIIPQGESAFNATLSVKTNVPIKRAIEAFLGDQPRNTVEILEQIYMQMGRFTITTQQLCKVLSEDKDIVKVGPTNRSGILSSGDYDIAVWASRDYITWNIPGWRDGIPILIDDEGTLFFGDEPVAD
tara:strand:- start:107 stop:2248 length:2142 start_codon:yes stop_codon:yes gene_type:complete